MLIPCDAAPDVEHLRLEISENREVFYRINDVTLMMFRRCQQLLFSCFFFFCEQERKTGREGEGSFLFFSKWFSSRQLGFWCSFPNKRKTINNKISLGQFIVYWQFFDLEEGPYKSISLDWQGIIFKLEFREQRPRSRLEREPQRRIHRKKSTSHQTRIEEIK